MDISANCGTELDKAEIGTPRTGKRGRPPAEIISSLIDEGSRSQHKLKCNHCNRVFPREKSLSAHRRTHTGEKPYICSFPSPKCNKSFAQSGQLKTHERLHTNEKCFKCPVDDCSTRYRHSNRKCRKHAHLGLKLVRSPDPNFPQNVLAQCSPPVREWLLGFLEKQERRHTPKRPSSMQKSGQRSSVTGADAAVPAEHPSALRSLHYGSQEAPAAAADHPDAAPHAQEADERDWNTAAWQRRSFGSLSLCREGTGASSSMASNGGGHVTTSAADVQGQFVSPKDLVLKYSSCSGVITTPQRNNSLSLSYDHTPASTPVRNSFLSTPKDGSHYVTPKNKSYLSSMESSYYSTPGAESTYGTPVGSSNPSTPTSSDYFSTPLAKDIHFPSLGSDLTSTPLASDLLTPHRSALSYHSHPEAEQRLARNSLPSPNKRAKSRRGLGPLMDASTKHNVKQESEVPAQDARLGNVMPQLSPTLSGLSPSKRIKSRRGLGPLMEATTNSNIKEEPAGTPSVEARLESSMPLSSPSISSSISDENAYLHNENAPPRSLPLYSPQFHSLCHRSTLRHQVPPKKIDTYRCLDMDGIKPLNIDEPFASDRYGSNLYSNNTKKVHMSDNHCTPSFTRHAYPARVAMEMTAELFGSYSRPAEQEGSSPGAKYCSAVAHSSSASPAPQQSKLRATLMGDSRYSPLTYSQRPPHTTGHSAVAPDVSDKQHLRDALLQNMPYSPDAKEDDWNHNVNKQSLDYNNQESNANVRLTYENTMPASDGASFSSHHPASNRHWKKVSFAITVHSTDTHSSPENYNSYSVTDSFTDEDEDFASSADDSSASLVHENVSLHEDIYSNGSADDRFEEGRCPVNLSKTSCNRTLEEQYSEDLDCTSIDVVSLPFNSERSETFPEQDMSVMAPLPSQEAAATQQNHVTKPSTPTKRLSSSVRNFSPRKVVPKKRWMSRIRSQVSDAAAAASACPSDPPSQALQPRATVLCLALQQLQQHSSHQVTTEAQPQVLMPHAESDSQPLNLSTR